MLYDFLGVFGYFGRKNIPPDLRSSDLPSKRLLGKGLASIGYETEWNGVRYARKDFVAVPSDIFRQEAGVLLKLPDHENVVKTHGLTVDKLSCSLVLDYMDDKLTDFIMKRRDPASEHDSTLQESLGLILQIARAMEHLHKHGILHGDLKSRNILVTYRNDVDESLLLKSVKVADFGLVQTKRKSMPYVSHQARKLDMVRWKAPEILMGLYREATSPDPDFDEEITGSACVTRSDDAYCFGLTCFQILTGEEPYPKRNWRELVIDIVSNEGGLKLPPNISCPQDLRELVDVCCAVDPDKRPTFVDICEKLERMRSLQPRASPKRCESLVEGAESDVKNMGKDVINTEIDLEEMLPNVERANPKRSESLVEGAEGDVKNMGKEVINTEIDLEEMLPNVERASPKRSESLVEGAEGDVKNMGKEVINAEIEREEMLPIVERASPKQSGSSVERAEGDVKNMEEAVTDKCFNAESDAEDLSYMRQPQVLRVFTLQELKSATKGFDLKNLLGEGEFSHVYKGTIKQKSKFHDGEEKLEVAIKQLNTAGLQGHNEWMTEVHFLSMVDNPYLVKLVGYCAEDDERGIRRLLVYEYMINKGLDDHIFGTAPPVLPWDVRVKVALGAARGLAYLHDEKRVIFRDFKTANVLLDEEFNPKLYGFGLARQGPDGGRTHVSSGVKGTYGYAAPEYIQTGHLTFKSDVFSFGVVLLEILTGRRAMDRNRPRVEQRLLEWVKPFINDPRKFHYAVDARLETRYPLKAAMKFATIAIQCLVKQPKARPDMVAVVEGLKKVLEMTYLWETPTGVTSTPTTPDADTPRGKTGGLLRAV